MYMHNEVDMSLDPRQDMHALTHVGRHWSPESRARLNEAARGGLP